MASNFLQFQITIIRPKKAKKKLRNSNNNNNKQTFQQMDKQNTQHHLHGSDRFQNHHVMRHRCIIVFVLYVFCVLCYSVVSVFVLCYCVVSFFCCCYIIVHTNLLPLLTIIITNVIASATI